jgi:hypothetical protein
MGKEIQLIYLSDLLHGQEKELPSILETSVRRDGEDGITGMLLYNVSLTEESNHENNPDDAQQEYRPNVRSTSQRY